MKYKKYAVIGLALGFSHLSFAQISPWLPIPGSLNINLSQVEQTADEFYFGDQEQNLPSDLSLSTTALNITYGISDNFALDAKIGYAESDFDPAAGQNLSGLIDTNIGVTWQLVNEYAAEGWPSISARLGVIIDGDYDTGAINAIGDGGNGVELSFAYGKEINSYLDFSSDIGIRERSDGVPSEIFYGTTLYIAPIDRLTAFVSYRVDDSRDGLQIGGSGFSPDRFPEVEEDKQYVQLGAQYAFTDRFGAGLSVAQVIDGRNTPISDVYALNLSYNF